MLLLRRPSDEWLREWLRQQQQKPFSYAEVAATQGRRGKEDCQDLVAARYDVDHYRVRLGSGEACFDAACAALRQWRQHRFADWVQLLFPDTALEVNATVGVLASHRAAYSLSACKICYVVNEADEDGAARRFGFAYGTTETHVERGEERFLVEWLRGGGGGGENSADSDAVYYDLLAFSKPQNWFTRLGYPVARAYQSFFATGSCKAMQEAVATVVGNNNNNTYTYTSPSPSPTSTLALPTANGAPPFPSGTVANGGLPPTTTSSSTAATMQTPSTATLPLPTVASYQSTPLAPRSALSVPPPLPATPGLTIMPLTGGAEAPKPNAPSNGHAQ